MSVYKDADIFEQELGHCQCSKCATCQTRKLSVDIVTGTSAAWAHYNAIRRTHPKLAALVLAYIPT